MSISGQTYTTLATKIIGKLDEFVSEHELNEDVVSVLLRLLGFVNTVEEDDSTETFVSSFLKRKDQSSENAKKLFKQYLKGLKSRVEKWQKDTNTSRINKIKRLLGESEQLPDSEITLDDSLDVAVQKVRKFQKQVSEGQDTIGLLNTQAVLYNAASDKVDALVSVLPTSQFGNFGGEIVSLLKADNVFLTDTSLRLNRRVSALTVELNKLQRQEKYISTGITLDNAQGKMSLKKIVEIMLYLMEKVEYKCKECFYFNSGLCLYGANNLKASPDNSCLEVYKKEDNPFWKVSDSALSNAKSFAERL